MLVFGRLVSNFREIIHTVSRHSSHLPPHARYRLATWLLFEIIIRKPALPAPGKKITRETQKMIENQVSIFAGYMVLFAHDDAVDKYNLNTPQIYDHLSRYLSAFLIGLSIEEASLNVGSYLQELERWFPRLQNALSEYPQIREELPSLFAPPAGVRGLQKDEPITIRNLLLESGYDVLCRDWLNVSIVSSLEMGKAFREILRILREHLGEDARTQEAKCAFFLKLLVQCMYAQAHSPEQKDLVSIRYARFIELSYLKSTILMDLINYVSDLVYEERFFATRHNPSRACDQIFDDLKDYEEDTADQIVGILHMYILEQGRLAEKYLSLIEHEPNLTIATVQELLADSTILQPTIYETFIYQNPFVQAARDPDGKIRMEAGNAETILYELWVNSPAERNWPIVKLASRRAALSAGFREAWEGRNYPAALDILHISNFPTALLTSFSHFVSRHKKVIINAYTGHRAPRAGYVGYYTVMLGLNGLWLSFWMKRVFRFLLSPGKTLLASKRGSHGELDPN